MALESRWADRARHSVPVQMRQNMHAYEHYNQTWSDDHPAVVHLEEFDIEWYDDTNDDWVNPCRPVVYARDHDLEGPSFMEIIEDWIAHHRVPCHLCFEVFSDDFFLEIHLKRDHKVVWK